jgi:hypothetical protein
MYYKENPYATLSYPQQSTSQEQYERLRHRDSSPLLPDGYVEANDDYYSSQGAATEGNESGGGGGNDGSDTVARFDVKSYLKNPWVMLVLAGLVVGLVYYMFFSGSKESYTKTHSYGYKRM